MGANMLKNKINVNPSGFVDEFNGNLYIIRSIVNEVNTADIVQVVSVDADKKTVTVIPIVSNVNVDDEKEPESNIYGVKYIQWQFGTNAIEATPSVGDIGLMVICKKDISSIDSGVVASNRRFNPADGIYIGGLFGFNSQPTQIIKFDSAGISVSSPTTVNVNAPIVNIGDANGVLKPVARDGDQVMAGTTVVGLIKASTTNVNAT